MAFLGLPEFVSLTGDQVSGNGRKTAPYSLMELQCRICLVIEEFLCCTYHDQDGALTAV